MDQPPAEVDAALLSRGVFLAAGLKEGRLFAAGPFGAQNHGLYIIAAMSKAEAEAFIAEDPGVSAHVVSASMRPWTPFNLLPPRKSACAYEIARWEPWIFSWLYDRFWCQKLPRN